MVVKVNEILLDLSSMGNFDYFIFIAGIDIMISMD